MESKDEEKEYEHNVWEIYRREWATASSEKRAELNKRMHRWQELMKNGWTANQAYIRVMQEESDFRVAEKPLDKSLAVPSAPRMRKAPLVFLSLALVVAIVYGIVITQQKNALNTELKTVQSVLVSTQAELSSTRGTLSSVRTELDSTKQTLTSTKTELSTTKLTLVSTQSELTSTKQTLASTQTELGSQNQKLSSVQSELGTTKAKLEVADAKLQLYKDTLGIDIYSGVQPRIQKGNLSLLRLNNTTTANNPSWQQLISFLLADPTDDKTYRENRFDCVDFAEMLHNNAEAAGIKTAFVTVDFRGDPIGHALNAFKTTDRGLVYVDCTGDDAYLPTFWEWLYEQSHPIEWDKIAYVVKGKECGFVSIDRATSPEYSFYERIGKASGDGWRPMGIVESIGIYW